jgi:hypothetical protein
MGNIASAGLGIVGQVMDYNSKIDQANAQRKQAVTQMNLTFQNYEIERQDAFDSAVDEITKTRMKAESSQATVQTAIGEQMGQGRTSQLLMRNAVSKESMAVSDIKDNYSRQSNEIDLNKESVLKSTQSYVKQIKDPSILGLAVGIASSTLGAINQGNNAKADAQLKGVPFDWDNYWLHGSGVTPRKKGG